MTDIDVVESAPVRADVQVEDRVVSGPHGPIPVRTYTPRDATRGLVWAHGGAFAFGGLDQPESDWVARRLADLGVAVVAVDYRLSPVPGWLAAAAGIPESDGVHFPVASEEVTAAFLWATGSVPGVEPSGWSLGGASAGANLAAGSALRLRDTGGPSPRSLVLAYGLFHSTLPPMSSELAASYTALPPQEAVFTADVVDLIALNYVGDPLVLTDAYAFPGGHDLAALPPTFLLNSDTDSLRASAQQFGAELAQAGVDVLIARETGSQHGHLDGSDNPASSQSVQRMALWLTTDLLTAPR